MTNTKCRRVEKSTYRIFVGPVSSGNRFVNDSDVWGILGVVVGETSTTKKSNFQHVKEIVWLFNAMALLVTLMRGGFRFSVVGGSAV